MVEGPSELVELKRSPAPLSIRFEVVAVQSTVQRSPASLAPRVALLDNRAERRQLMRKVVETGPGSVVVVGEADNASDAVGLVGEQQVDVVIVEVQLPVEIGLQTIAEVRASCPHVGIAVCSFHLAADTQRQALECGADIYLAKPITPRLLGETVADLTARSRGEDRGA
jgi:DNA-binding NarL/FixJ family response regulator